MRKSGRPAGRPAGSQTVARLPDHALIVEPILRLFKSLAGKSRAAETPRAVRARRADAITRYLTVVSGCVSPIKAAERLAKQVAPSCDPPRRAAFIGARPFQGRVRRFVARHRKLSFWPMERAYAKILFIAIICLLNSELKNRSDTDWTCHPKSRQSAQIFDEGAKGMNSAFADCMS